MPTSSGSTASSPPSTSPGTPDNSSHHHHHQRRSLTIHPIDTEPLADDDWRGKYLDMKLSYRDVKQRNKTQAKRARQLLVAVTAKLQEKEEEIEKIRNLHHVELTRICQSLLHLQACMTREQERLEGILLEKDLTIQSQKLELDRVKEQNQSLLQSQKTTGNRNHGSFRQYKKEKKSQHRSNVTDDLGSMGSSEESPSSTPKNSRPPLRLSLSTGSAENLTYGLTSLSIPPKKGILKSASSYGSLDLSSNPGSILHNLQKMIQNHPLVTEKLAKIEHEKSDSGRESEEFEHSMEHQPLSLPPMSNIVKSRSDSANSSFDSTNESIPDGLVQELKNKGWRMSLRVPDRKKEKPPKPPPRSSTTKLTTTNGPSSIVNVENGKLIEPHKTIVNIKPDEAKSEKRVTFSHETVEHVQSEVILFDPAEKNAIKLLDETIKNYKPSFETSTRFGFETKSIKKDVSYFEPYL